MDMILVIVLILVIISQYIHRSKHHLVYPSTFFVSYTSVKLEKKKCS